MSWTIYSKNNCPYCDKAKAFLQSQAITFIEKKIDEQPEFKEELLGIVPNARTVPQIFHHDLCIGGFDKLEAYYMSLTM